MTELFKYQKKGIRKINHFRGRALLADEMGLGKTIQALTWAWEKPEERCPAVIVCPAHLKMNWEREISIHLSAASSEILEGRKITKETPLDITWRKSFVVVNYDILDAWAEWLSGYGAKTLILDEAHFCKNPKARRTKAVKKIARKFKYKIAISGTPLTNRPSELFPALQIIRPDVFKSFFSFAREYCQLRKDRFGWRYDGAKNLPELHALLNRTCMIRRRKEDVLTQLPPKRRHVVPLQIEKPGEYRKARDRFLEWLRGRNPDKVDSAAQSQKLVQLGYLKRLAAELKYKAAQEWIADFLEESDGKLVVMGVHHAMVDSLHTDFPGSVILTGKTPAKEKQKAVDAFQHNPKTRLFIGNIQAAGTGITLTAASDLAFVELGWTPGEHTQAEDRIHRIGQTESAMVHYLIAKDTIEEDTAELLQRKFKILDEVLDGASGAEKDFDLLTMLENGLLKTLG